MAVAAPLTPRPRGTIYEALPFFLERDQEGSPSQGWDREEDMTMPTEQQKTIHDERAPSKSFCHFPSICLQLNRRRLAGRGLERRPNHSAGGQQADSRHPGRMRCCLFLHLQCTFSTRPVPSAPVSMVRTTWLSLQRCETAIWDGVCRSDSGPVLHKTGQG